MELVNELYAFCNRAGILRQRARRASRQVDDDEARHGTIERGETAPC